MRQKPKALGKLPGCGLAARTPGEPAPPRSAGARDARHGPAGASPATEPTACPKQRRTPKAAVGLHVLLSVIRQFCFEQRLVEEEETIHRVAASQPRLNGHLRSRCRGDGAPSTAPTPLPRRGPRDCPGEAGAGAHVQLQLWLYSLRRDWANGLGFCSST